MFVTRIFNSSVVKAIKSYFAEVREGFAEDRRNREKGIIPYQYPFGVRICTETHRIK